MKVPPAKKIVILGPAYPYRGGNALFISYLYESLKKSYDVKVFNYKLLYPKLLFPGSTQFDDSKEIIFNIPNERIVNSISPLSWLATAKKIIKEKPDLVIIDWWHPFFALCHFSITLIIKLFAGIKILFITENFISHESYFFDKILTKIGIINSDLFLTLSDKVTTEIKNAKIDKKIYKSELPVYNGYKSTSTLDARSIRTELGFSPEDKVLLFFGYVRKYKGLDILLNTFSKVLKEDKSYKLLIVGEFYENEETYTKLIRNLGIGKSVVTVNRYVPNEDVEKYYLVSDLVVLPYRSATQSGILNVAYGFKKPVLVTDVGGLSEFVENESTGIIVPSSTSDDIYLGIKKFFSLREHINFQFNIEKKIESNSFVNLSTLFNKIFEEISNDIKN